MSPFIFFYVDVFWDYSCLPSVFLFAVSHVMWSAVHLSLLQQRKQYIAPLHVHKFLFTALEWLDVI